LRLNKLIGWITAVAVISVLAPWAGAQTMPFSTGKKPATPTVAPATVNDPLGRSTPQGTIVGFMMSAQGGDNERALKYLDTKKTGRSGRKLVDELQAVLESGFSGKLGMLNTKTEGPLDKTLPATKRLVGTITSESGSFDVLLERVQHGNEPPVWLFSSETLAKVPEVYEDLNVHRLDRYFPEFMKSMWFLWIPLWQWVYVLLIIPLSFIVATALTRLIVLILRIIRVRADHYVMTLTGPLRIFILALAIWTVSIVTRSVLVNLFWTYTALSLTIIGAIWLAVRLIDMIVKRKHAQWAGTPSGRVAMLQLIGKLSKVLTVIVGLLVVLYIAGINITAALTGLGIGGIALAFAAQKTLENLFGGIMIISDRPIRVGDFCKAGAYMGTVVTIGLRSTYIRTPERTIVSIPNGQLAVMSLENFALRDKIFLHHTINLRPETTSAQLTFVLEGVRKVLHDHPKVEAPAIQVNFIKFSDSALVLELNAYVEETVYETFMDIQEKILINIMNIIEVSGTSIAVPLQAVSLSRAPEEPKGPEKEK
jgi:MscS family membrane protein